MKVNLRQELSERPPKARMIELCQYLIENPKQVPSVFKWMKSDDIRLVQSSAWLLGDYLYDDNIDIQPYLEEIFEGIENPKHPGVVRSMFRILQNKDIPERERMVFYEICLDKIHNPRLAIAVRAFAMTTAVNIVRQHPELAGELIEVIGLIEEPSAGIRVRIKSALQILNDLEKNV